MSISFTKTIDAFMHYKAQTNISVENGVIHIFLILDQWPMKGAQTNM